VPKDPSMVRLTPTPPTKSLGETMAALDALEKTSLHIELEARSLGTSTS